MNYLLSYIKNIGVTSQMNYYEKRRLGIFNHLNFFALVIGIFIPVVALLSKTYFPPTVWILSFTPSLISVVVLLSNSLYKNNFALFFYFTFYPLATAILYFSGIDAGIELLFILYSILAIFFLQNTKLIFLSVSFSVSCFFLIYTYPMHFNFVLRSQNYSFFLINHLLPILFIALGLIFIKRENNSYQLQMQIANDELQSTNEAIKLQQKELSLKANLLTAQTEQLTRLDDLKNRLFSIISHDLKTPIYSLRNLFKNVQQYNIPGDEIKVLVPDIINDLNYTTGLMENLLQWAKSQMQGDVVLPQLIDIGDMVSEVQQLLRLQAETKQVYLNSKIDPSIYIFADKEMINLVLRNLISNAIKFTPHNGEIFVGATIKNETVEVFVKDNGTGISNDNLKRLFNNSYFTTNGTANESGTGLGLMLCNEFIIKNGGNIRVESELGKGSMFTFCLPKA
jgi:two-component system, sensor histidine kinase and response regulator